MNFEDFGFLTEDRIDKVIFVKEGTIPASTFNMTIPTGTSEVFFPHFSVSLDGVTWYSDESPRYSNSQTFADLSIRGQCYPNNIRMFPDTAGQAGFYRILGVKNDIQ